LRNTSTFFLLVSSSSGLALMAPAVALASEASESAPSIQIAQAAPSAPPARSQRLNPTGRAIALTVPARDGAAYLGDVPVTIGADDSISFPTARVLQLLETALAPNILEALRNNLAGRAEIGPADLMSAGLKAEYDPRTLELRFDIPVESRQSRSLSIAPRDRETIGDLVKPASYSAYLNLRGSFDVVEDGPDGGLGNPVMLLDGAVRLGSIVAESDAVWTPESRGVEFQRLGSRLVYDSPDDVLRFTAGDLQTQGQGFQTAPDIAGIGIVRSYSTLNPQQIIRPRGDRTFRLDRPSTVEVLVNGQQVRRMQLGPGNYNLRDFPFAQGSNDIRLNVLDDTGRTEVLRFNVFMDQNQLAKGIDEFGVFLGVNSPLGLRGPHYTDKPAFSGFYRRGVSDFLTVGANFQADKQIQMGGVELVAGTSIGTIGSHLAYSRSKGLGDGFAVQANFQRQMTRSSGLTDTFNLFVEHRSRRFAPVTFFLADNPYRYELGGGYSRAISETVYAGLDARYSKGRGLNPDVHNYRATLGWRLSANASLTAETRYQKDTRGSEVSGFITLSVRLGQYSSIRTEYDSRDNRMRASFQTIHGTGVGSYNVTSDIERSDFGSDLAVNANYVSNRADIGFTHYGSFSRNLGESQSQRSTFRLGTSIALADGAVSVGRPIYDSFAIVRPHKSLKGTDVTVEPSPWGYTANSGGLKAATMPNLSSYAERTIGVDVPKAPPGTDIGQGSFKVFPAYRSGYVLEVGSDYNVTALGNMVDVDGEPVALVSGKATEVAHPERAPLTIFTNRQGRFGAAGLAPGTWRLEMLDQKQSTFEIVIPENAEGIVRLGQISPNRKP
jgi:outer membrane usher protein